MGRHQKSAKRSGGTERGRDVMVISIIIVLGKSPGSRSASGGVVLHQPTLVGRSAVCGAAAVVVMEETAQQTGQV